MNIKIIKKNIKKYYKTVNLLKDLKMLVLNFNFFMNYIIHKMLVLLKNNLNYLKDSIFKYFFKKYNRLLFF